MSTIKTAVVVHPERICRIKRMRLAVNSKPDERPPAMVSFWQCTPADGKYMEGSMQWVHKFGPFYEVWATCETTMGSTYGYVDPDVVDPDSDYPPEALAGDTPKTLIKRTWTSQLWSGYLLRGIVCIGIGYLVGRYLFLLSHAE